MQRFYNKTCASLEVWLDNFKKQNYFRIKQFFATEPKKLSIFQIFLFLFRTFCPIGVNSNHPNVSKFGGLSQKAGRPRLFRAGMKAVNFPY
jgi:hypothetical protein